MNTATFAGVTVNLNEEGFLTDPTQWTPAIAIEIARAEGIPELSADHWNVINYCRAEAETTGTAPTLRQITMGTGISTKELFALYPKGPAKKVAKIAGLGKPEGCV